MAIPGIVTLGILGAVILAVPEIPGVRVRLQKVMARWAVKNGQVGKGNRFNYDPVADNMQHSAEYSAEQDEQASASSACVDGGCEEAVALAIEVERERREPYPREWE
jgi:hypothetical protein